MIQDNLKLLLQLYARPVAALGGIIDRGSVLFAAAAVLAVSVLMELAFLPGLTAALAQALPRPAFTGAQPSAASAPSAPGTAPADAEPGAPEAAPVAPGLAPRPFRPQAAVWSLAFGLATSNLSSVVALVVLYAPMALLFVTLLERVGSFGVAFRRDFGPLVVCVLMCWAAARLPFALAALALGFLAPARFLLAAGLWLCGALYFVALAALAIRTLFGVRLQSALATAALAPVGYLLTPLLPLLASPCLLFYGYFFFRGDVSWSLGARQGFRRHLEAATLNPRDADAHYQLGLIHQQRRQLSEAVARFQKAIEIDAGELGAHYQLGRIARDERRHAEAIRHFEAVVARDDRFAQHEVWREIGGTYLESGSFEHARWALDRYVGQRQHDPEGLCLLGEALAELGQADAARRTLAAAIEAAETAPDYRRRELARWRKRAAQRLAGLGPAGPGA